MEELYRRMKEDPPIDPRPQDDTPVVPPPDELEFISEAIRDVLEPTEHDSWWEENGDEWDRMADDPGGSFVLGGNRPDGFKGFMWGMEAYFGEEAPEWTLLDEPAAPFSLSAYKAGTRKEGERKIRGAAAGTGTGGGGDSSGDISFEQTPFANYWDSLPDLRITKRVYAFNAVDRMAALKFMMICTHNGMHGSAENQQAGHFLWGYVDQLDWMRRSGRLSSTPGSIKVDRQSWWGRVSFALTIAPLAAAVESGLWEENGVSILDGDDLQLPEMRRAVRAWRRVWRLNDADIAARVLVDMPVHDSLQERMRRAQWAAHLESLDAVEALYAKEFDALPSSAEREFARGWCRAARLFAEAASHTNFDRRIFPLGAGYPPERILRETGVDAGDATRGSLDSVPYGPPSLVAEAKNDPVVALNTHRHVKSVRWLGTLRTPLFATLRLLWRRACVSYPGRRGAGRVLCNACYGGRKARAVAWGRSFLFMFVPNLNYRKLTPPFGIDPAEEIEYDPDLKLRDSVEPPPRPAGSRPLNPLQRPWYDGRRPDPLAGGLEDDGLGTFFEEGMFPPGMVPADVSFEALQKIEREVMDDLRRAEQRLSEKEGSEGSSSDARRGDSAGSRPDASHANEGEETSPVDGDSTTNAVFL